MQYQEFLKRVQQRTALNTENDAARLVEVTLATLGERLYRTERQNLAAQLPNELKAFLTQRAEPETTRLHTAGFSIEEFYNRVSARTDTAFQDTKDRVRAVMAVLQEAIDPSVIQEVRESMSQDYQELF